MLAKKPLGQGAASRKYDILTALGVHALAGSKHDQRLGLRLITLVTARYNWQLDELSIGRPQIAELWNVDERTVKRELARLRDLDWITVKRPAARGRVAVYAVNWDAILRDTAPSWDRAGPDFAERLSAFSAAQTTEQTPKVVVPFPAKLVQGSPWDRACQALHSADPGFFGAWFAGLSWLGAQGGIVQLQAPSSFHAQYIRTHGMEKLYGALKPVMPEMVSIDITS